MSFFCLKKSFMQIVLSWFFVEDDTTVHTTTLYSDSLLSDTFVGWVHKSFIVQKLKKNKGLHFLTKQIFVYMTTLEVYYIAFFLSALKNQQPLLQYWHHNQGSVCPFYSMVVCSCTDLYIIFSNHVL